MNGSRNRKTRTVFAALLAAAVLALTGCASRQDLRTLVWGNGQLPDGVLICCLRPDGTMPVISVPLQEPDIPEFLSALEGIHPGSAAVIPQEAGPIQVAFRGGTEFTWFSLQEDGTLYVQKENNRQQAYRLDERDAQSLVSLCGSYTDPDGGFPGLAFLREFFTIDKDGRWSIWEKALFSSYSGAVAEAMEPYHAGLAPYVMPEVLTRIELGHYLARMELRCMAQARNWELCSITLEERSVPGSYNFMAGLSSTGEPAAELFFSGRYLVNRDGLVSSFFIDLEE